MTEFADHSHRVVAHPSALARLRAPLIDVSTLSPFMRWMLYATQAILVVLGILIAFRSSLAQSQHPIPSVFGLPAGVLGAALPISVFLSAALLAGIFRGPAWLRWPALVLLTLWLLYLGFVMVRPRQVVHGSYGTLLPAALQLAIVGGYCWVTVRARSLSLPALVLSCAVLSLLRSGYGLSRH